MHICKKYINMKKNYRIVKDANLYLNTGKVLLYGTGSNIGSWFTLIEARKIIENKKNYTIIEICNTTGEILGEIL